MQARKMHAHSFYLGIFDFGIQSSATFSEHFLPCKEKGKNEAERGPGNRPFFYKKWDSNVHFGR